MGKFGAVGGVVLDGSHDADDVVVEVPDGEFVGEEPVGDALAVGEEFDDFEHGKSGFEDEEIVFAELFGEASWEEIEIGFSDNVGFALQAVAAEEGEVGREQVAIAVFGEKEDMGEVVEEVVEPGFWVDAGEEGVPEMERTGVGLRWGEVGHEG